jgi:hypothetical protein
MNCCSKVVPTRLTYDLLSTVQKGGDLEMHDRADMNKSS